MLPLPRHLLKTDPEDVIREIENDPLSEFVWSIRPGLEQVASHLRSMRSTLRLTSGKEIPVTTECCAQ